MCASAVRFVRLFEVAHLDEVVRPPPRTGAQHLSSGAFALKGLIKANTEAHVHDTTQSFIDPIDSYIELVTDPKYTNLEVVEKIRRPFGLKKLNNPVVKMKDCPHPCNYGKFMEAEAERDDRSTVPGESHEARSFSARLTAPSLTSTLLLARAQVRRPPRQRRARRR